MLIYTINPRSQFDLVIVDEAHKMAAYTRWYKKEKSFSNQIVSVRGSILKKTRHVLLLTATPHKGDSENFRHLMKLIDEDVFTSSMAE